MPRVSPSAILFLILMPITSPADEPNRNPAPAAPLPPVDPNLIPDPRWTPKPGDSAVVYHRRGDSWPATFDLSALSDLAQSARAGDVAGARELIADGKILMLPHMTRVLVIERHDNPFFAKGLFVLEIRVDSGEYIDKKLWIAEASVARLMRRPDPVQPPSGIVPGSDLPRGKGGRIPKAVAPRPVDPVTKSAATLQLGKNLRFEGKRDGAIEYFRRSIKEAPGSAPAREAGQQLKAMGVTP